MVFLWTSAHEAGAYQASRQYHDDIRKLETLTSRLKEAYLHGNVESD